MAQDASTASANRAGGASSRPNTIRAPSERRTAQMRSPSGHLSPMNASRARARAVMSTCPRGTIVMAATSGRKDSGRWTTRLSSAGEGGLHRRRSDFTVGTGRGPSSGRIRSNRAPPRRDSGAPAADAARSEAGTPTRRAAPVTEPADVPTMMSAWRGSQWASRSRAASTPA